MERVEFSSGPSQKPYIARVECMESSDDVVGVESGKSEEEEVEIRLLSSCAAFWSSSTKGGKSCVRVSKYLREREISKEGIAKKEKMLVQDRIACSLNRFLPDPRESLCTPEKVEVDVKTIPMENKNTNVTMDARAEEEEEEEDSDSSIRRFFGGMYMGNSGGFNKCCWSGERKQAKRLFIRNNSDWRNPFSASSLSILDCCDSTCSWMC